MTAPKPAHDVYLEWLALATAKPGEEQRAAWERLQERVSSRAKEQVEAMERERGLKR